MPELESRAYYTRSNLPPEDDARWSFHQKKVATRMMPVAGPFTVETDEGPLTRLEDGWLCVDARGYPYPLAADEYDLIYEPVIVTLEGPSKAETIARLRLAFEAAEYDPAISPELAEIAFQAFAQPLEAANDRS